MRSPQRGKTDGAAKNDKRATLRVVGQDMSVAVYGAHDMTNNIQIRSVTIDGNRPAMGVLAGGAALLELGGNSPGHQVTNSRILNPRGWSCLHVIECVAGSGARLILQGLRKQLSQRLDHGQRHWALWPSADLCHAVLRPPVGLVQLVPPPRSAAQAGRRRAWRSLGRRHLVVLR